MEKVMIYEVNASTIPLEISQQEAGINHGKIGRPRQWHSWKGKLMWAIIIIIISIISF